MKWTSFVIAVLAFPVVFAAQEPNVIEAEPEAIYQRLRVLVLPMRDYRDGETRLFFVDSQKEKEREASPLLSRLREDVISSLESSPKLSVVSLKKVLSRPPFKTDLKRGVELVRDRYHLARDLYDDLRLEQAEESLEIASQAIRRWSLEILDVSLASKTALIRGLNAFERGETGKAHIAMKQSLMLRPDQRFRKGYYPESVEKALKAAWADLQSMESKALVMGSERTESLMKQMKADVVVTGYLRRGEEGDVFRLVAYDRKTRAFTMRETLVVSDTGEVEVDRAVSRWLACLDVAFQDADQNQSSTGRLLVDTRLSHGLYFVSPTREYFHNIGFSLNLEYQIQESIDVATRIQLFRSIPDTRRDLLGTVTSFRWIVGAGFGFGGNGWRWYIRPGLELHYVGKLSVVTDPDCKFFGIKHPRCDTGTVTDTEQALLGGLHLSTGWVFDLDSSVYLVVDVGGSVYISFREDSNLNYLLDSGFGLGYRF